MHINPSGLGAYELIMTRPALNETCLAFGQRCSDYKPDVSVSTSGILSFAAPNQYRIQVVVAGLVVTKVFA